MQSTHGSSSSSGLSSGTSSKQGIAVCVVAAFFVLVEVWIAVFSRVVPMIAVGVVKLDVGGDVDARCKRSCATFLCLSVCLYVYPHSLVALSRVSSSFLPSSSHRGVEELKSVSRGISWSRQLLPAPRESCPCTFDAVFKLDLHGVFESDEATKVFDFPFWR